MKTRNFDYTNAARLLIQSLGSTVDQVKIYTYCDHVAKSGMSRNIKAFVIINNNIFNLGYGMVKGCGMDMGFHTAETIFSIAYPSLKYQESLTHFWV